MLDVAIIGGGVAGSSLAYCLAKRGLATAVWDKAFFPRPKACGGGLLPRGVAALREMGLEPPAFPKISGFRIVARTGAAVEAPFPSDHGLATRREIFDAWLLDRARDAGAQVHECATMPGDVDARYVVAADGLHSRFGDPRPDRPLRIGFATHVRGVDVGDKVEIRFRDDGEVYLAPAGDDTLVAVLGSAARLRARAPAEIISHFLDGASVEITSPILGMGPLGRRVREVTRGNLLLTGDAAGAPDPITGEGMSLALRSALVAADAIARDDLPAYAEWRTREGDNARRFGRRLIRFSPFSGPMVSGLQRRPDIMRRLMRMVAGEESGESLSVSTAIALLVS